MKDNILIEYAEADFIEKTAQYIATCILDKLTLKSTIHIALSGGSTPLPILSKLSEQDIDWSKITFYLVDERCVPIVDSQSNFGNIKIHFFDKIQSSYHSIVGNDDDYLQHAFKYEELLKKNLHQGNNGLPKFDLILLGMGDDGHTASLFPNTKGLQETKKLVFVNEVPILNTQRITFSFPLILNAEEILILIKGNKKIQIMKELLIGEGNSFPMQTIVTQHNNLTWIVAN